MTERKARYDLLNEPPEGVLAGESVPRENEANELYQRIKDERLATLERHQKLATNHMEEHD